MSRSKPAAILVGTPEPPDRIDLLRMILENEQLQRSVDEFSVKSAADRWDSTAESFAAHSDRLGYAIGAQRWGRLRASREGDILNRIASGLGESLDRETLIEGLSALIDGYRRAYQQFRFPSDHLPTVDPSLTVFSEIDAESPYNALSRLLSLAGLTPSLRREGEE